MRRLFSFQNQDDLELIITRNVSEGPAKLSLADASGWDTPIRCSAKLAMAFSSLQIRLILLKVHDYVMDYFRHSFGDVGLRTCNWCDLKRIHPHLARYCNRCGFASSYSRATIGVK